MTPVRVFFVVSVVALHVPVVAAADPGKVTLRVLSYNIHHGEGNDGKVDLPRLAKVIADAKPDLVALQEVDVNTRRTGGVDQPAELARLTGLNGRFAKQMPYDGGEYGQAFLSRVPIDGAKVHVLPGDGKDETRVAGEVRVTVAGRPLTFVTTHLHHANAGVREKQAAELNRLFGSADHPVILAGDLNATPDQKSLTVLAEYWTNATANPSRPTFPSKKAVKQIDYVLTRPEGRFKTVEWSALDEPVASDHLPVLTVLEWLP